jgi:predicted Zn finger-like uncharacterized protein
MLIHCPECRTGFRFEKRWMRGYKGARVRCRNCGSMIVVLNPSGSLPFPAKVKEPEVPAQSDAPSSISPKRMENFVEEPEGGRTREGPPPLHASFRTAGEPRERSETGFPGAAGEVAGVQMESGVGPGMRAEVRQEEITQEGFDISEMIAPEPDGLLHGTEDDPPSPPIPPVYPPLSEEDVYEPFVEVLPPGHTEGWQPENSAPGIPVTRAYSPRSTYKVVTDFALITVILIFGGVCGYFALRYILNVVGVELG